MIHFTKNQTLVELSNKVLHGVGHDEGLGVPYITFTMQGNDSAVSLAFNSIDAIKDLDYSIFLTKGIAVLKSLPLSGTLRRVVEVLMKTEQKKCTLDFLQKQIKNIDLGLISQLDPFDIVLNAYTLSDEDITGEDPKNVLVSLKTRFIDNYKFFEHHTK